VTFAKRTLDVVLAGAALLLLLPVLLAIAAVVALVRSGSVLYSETRVGRGGRPLRVLKFRTLRAGSPSEPGVAVGDDPRITKPGRWLRRTRLDELPQLGAVLCGTMSLVGPRPQTTANLSALDAATRERLLSVRPGLTSRAALAHLGEDDVLAECADPVRCYRTILVPAKARMDVENIAERSFGADLLVLLQTSMAILSPSARQRSRARVRALLEAGTSAAR
jgi:lipopolysaccharide/colanic/teichoic acid biosynthesis glycosyltransferase